jgi:hypothetical protein
MYQPLPQRRNTTDGLASAYQRTQTTGAGFSVSLDTSGQIRVAMMNIPTTIVVSPGDLVIDKLTLVETDPGNE